MKLFVNCVIFFFISLVICCSAEDGFLNVTCNSDRDCYVLDDFNQGLRLACWNNVHKCKCQNTIGSNFNLRWENNECLMSKYGPCGDKGSGLAVGCSDGFICVDNRCIYPTDTKSVKVTPYAFEESKCTSNGCKFSKDLQLQCGYYGSNQCLCEKLYIADGRSTYWDIRSYDGENNCSVGQFGPCGTKHGIRIDCHGDGISCVNGTCINPNHPHSEVGEGCESVKNCKEGLLCSLESVCTEPFTLAEGKICSSDNECRKGLHCLYHPNAGPWSYAYCSQPPSMLGKPEH